MRYLGTITVPTGAARTNYSTATGFTILPSVSQIYLSPDTDNCFFACHYSPTFVPWTGVAAPLGSSDGLIGPIRTTRAPNFYVAVLNVGGTANVKVFAG